jgi:hypothetical protein
MCPDCHTRVSRSVWQVCVRAVEGSLLRGLGCAVAAGVAQEVCISRANRRQCDADSAANRTTSADRMVPEDPDDGCHTRAPRAYHRVGKRAFERSRSVGFSTVVTRLRPEWGRRSA